MFCATHVQLRHIPLATVKMFQWSSSNKLCVQNALLKLQSCDAKIAWNFFVENASNKHMPAESGSGIVWVSPNGPFALNVIAGKLHTYVWNVKMHFVHAALRKSIALGHAKTILCLVCVKQHTTNGFLQTTWTG